MTDLDVLERRNEALQKSLNEEKAEVLRLRIRIDELESANSGQEQAEEIVHLNDTIMYLRASLQSSEEEKNKLRRMMWQGKDESTKCHTAMLEERRHHADQEASWIEEREQLKANVLRVMESRDEVQDELDRLTTLYEENNESLDKLQSEYKALTFQLNDSKKANEVWRNKNAELVKLSTEKDQRIEELNRQIRSLRRTLENSTPNEKPIEVVKVSASEIDSVMVEDDDDDEAEEMQQQNNEYSGMSVPLSPPTV